MLLACGPDFGVFGLFLIGSTWFGGPVLAGTAHAFLQRGNLRHRIGVALAVNGGLLSAGVLAVVIRAGAGLDAAWPPLAGLGLALLGVPRLNRQRR